MNPTVHYTQISVFNTCVCVHGQVKAVLYEVSVLANKKQFFEKHFEGF